MVAVLTTDAIAQLRLSVDEYLGAQLPEGYRYELVNGVVAMTPMPSPGHDSVLAALIDHLHPYKLSHSNIVAHLSVRSGVAIRELHTVREPDIALYATWDPHRRDFRFWKEQVPFLVAEVVSPGQEERDYEEKRAEYLRAGVREYWIADPEARRFTALRREGDAWQQVVLPPPDLYETPVLPGLVLNVRRVLLLDE